MLRETLLNAKAFLVLLLIILYKIVVLIRQYAHKFDKAIYILSF